MPAVGRLWPSDDYDDDDDDGSPTVRHHISWALSGFISLFRDATLSPHCPRGRAIQPGILNLLLCMKGGCWRPGFTFDTCVFCLDVKKNCDIIKKNMIYHGQKIIFTFDEIFSDTCVFFFPGKQLFVSLLKSCNYWRSCFLISGYHYNPHVFTGQWAWCHHVP